MHKRFHELFVNLMNKQANEVTQVKELAQQNPCYFSSSTSSPQMTANASHFSLKGYFKTIVLVGDRKKFTQNQTFHSCIPIMCLMEAGEACDFRSIALLVVKDYLRYIEGRGILEYKI